MSRVLVWVCLASITASSFTLTRRIRLPEDVGDTMSIFNGILMGTPFYLAVLMLVLGRMPEDSRVKAFLTAVRYADRVYHIAGVLGGKDVPLSAYQDAHVRLTRDLLMKMERGQQFLYMSSAYVLSPEKPYELSKLEGEAATRVLARQDGVDYTIVRPGFVFGERDKHLLLLFKLVKRMGRWFPIIGGGDNQVRPTYVGDVVDAVTGAGFRNDAVQVCGSPVTMRDFIWGIADAVGVIRPQYSVKWVPGWVKGLVRWDFFSRSRVFWSDWKCNGMGDGLQRTADWYARSQWL